MLSKKKRLNLKKDFKWVVSGKKDQTDSFKLMYRYSDNSYPLVGIALSKSQFKKATDRNKARRLTSKVIEEIYSSLRKDLNLVIMPKSVIFEKSPGELFKEVNDVKTLLDIN